MLVHVVILYIDIIQKSLLIQTQSMDNIPIPNLIKGYLQTEKQFQDRWYGNI